MRRLPRAHRQRTRRRVHGSRGSRRASAARRRRDPRRRRSRPPARPADEPRFVRDPDGARPSQRSRSTQRRSRLLAEVAGSGAARARRDQRSPARRRPLYDESSARPSPRRPMRQGGRDLGFPPAGTESAIGPGVGGATRAVSFVSRFPGHPVARRTEEHSRPGSSRAGGRLPADLREPGADPERRARPFRQAGRVPRREPRCRGSPARCASPPAAFRRPACRRWSGAGPERSRGSGRAGTPRCRAARRRRTAPRAPAPAPARSR